MHDSLTQMCMKLMHLGVQKHKILKIEQENPVLRKIPNL